MSFNTSSSQLRSRLVGGITALMLLFSAPSFAVDNSLFLNPVGPVVEFTGPNPADPQLSSYLGIKPTIDTFIMTHTAGGIFNPPAASTLPDIVLAEESDVRVYFYSERAGFSNSIGFITDGNNDLDDPSNLNSLIFPRTESIIDSAGPPNDLIEMNDFVDVGRFFGGTVFDLFLIQDGADALPADGITEHVFWTDSAFNSDGMSHAFIVPFSDGLSDYFLIGMEDLLINSPTGANIDFTDFIGVVQVTPVPEPSTYLMMGSFLLLAVALKRRQSKNTV